MPVLFFLTMIPDLNKLALGSFVAQVSNLLAFGVVLWFDFDHLHLATEKDHLTEFSLEGFPFFFSIAIYCFEVRRTVCEKTGILLSSFEKYFLKPIYTLI